MRISRRVMRSRAEFRTAKRRPRMRPPFRVRHPGAATPHPESV